MLSTDGYSRATAGITAGSGVSQHSVGAIQLTHLPPELLCIIMQQLDTSTDILMLSQTCRQLQEIFEASFDAPARLYHSLQHNKVMLALHQQNHGRLVQQTATPTYGTAEWEKLKGQPIEATSDKATYQADLLKKTYITAWDLLLQPGMYHKHDLTSRLTNMLFELSPYIVNVKQYISSLPPQLKHAVEYTMLKATLDKNQREQLLGEDMWTQLEESFDTHEREQQNRLTQLINNLVNTNPTVPTIQLPAFSLATYADMSLLSQFIFPDEPSES